MPKIMIVDDVPTNIKVLGELLKDKYEVLVANNGNKAIQVASAKLPDLILMDVIMPEMDGITACHLLRKQPETSEIPIIFITAKNETDDMVNGFEAGGVDYITKPFNPAELNARIKTHLDLKKSREELRTIAMQLKTLNDELAEKNVQLNNAIENLHKAAMTDPLTGLGNRRFITEKVNEEISRCRRVAMTFSLMIADIDYFKKINDTYGHECGDYVLQSVANALKNGIRNIDDVARWGGEEFLFLLPDTNADGAIIVGERLRQAIEQLPLIYQDQSITVTMTFGVSEYDQSGSMDQTVKTADHALYTGKETGKNRVVSTNFDRFHEGVGGRSPY